MYLLPGLKVSSKTNIPSSKKNGGSETAHLPLVLAVDRSKTKQNSIMVKSIDNAFDQMELCLVLLVEVIFK